MSDYNTDVGVSRDQMVTMIAYNYEHFAYVVAGVMDDVCADDVIVCGSLPNNIDTKLVVGNLRAIADAIESGGLS